MSEYEYEFNRWTNWTNYETLNVGIWISRDENYRYWQERARELSTLELANELRTEFFDNMPKLPQSTYADLMLCALQRVDWFDVANGLKK